ncbi:MAG: hypothetical protein ACRDK2_01435, partial [Solirubrobacteraceae bacterium]
AKAARKPRWSDASSAVTLMASSRSSPSTYEERGKGRWGVESLSRFRRHDLVLDGCLGVVVERVQELSNRFPAGRIAVEDGLHQLLTLR